MLIAVGLAAAVVLGITKFQEDRRGRDRMEISEGSWP
jgi:hypothetical protein